MRLNLEENPKITTKNLDEFKKIAAIASSQEKTLLNKKQYTKSVEGAKNIAKGLAFRIW